MFSEPRESIKTILDQALNQDDEFQMDKRITQLSKLMKSYGNKTVTDHMQEVLQQNLPTYRRTRVNIFLQKFKDQFQISPNINLEIVNRARGDSISVMKRLKGFALVTKAVISKKIHRIFNELRQAGSQVQRKKISGSDKIRGRIILALFTQYFPAELKKKEFFYRWKVRSNKVHVQGVINKLVLQAKITPEIAFWRLRNLIKNPYDDSLFGRKLNMFDLTWKKWEINAKKKMKSFAFKKLLENRQKIKQCEKMILQFEKKLKKVDKKRGFKQLKRFSRVVQLKQKFFSVIKQAGFGGVRSVFQLWKNLPIILDPKDKRVKMEEALFKYTKQRGGVFLKKMRDLNNLAITAKRRALINLLNKTMSDHKRLFLRWLTVTRDTKQYKKFQSIQKFMDKMNGFINSSVLGFLKSDNSDQIKSRAIQRWLSNAAQFQRTMLKRWRLQTGLMKVNRGIVTIMLSNLNSQLKNGERGKLRSTLRQFYTFMRIKKVQINFFKSLLSTNAGQIQAVFRKWHEIPARTVLPANLFQGGMQRFATKKIREPLDAIKQMYQDAENIKQRTMHTMLQKTMSSNRRMFIDWKQMVERDKMIKRCKYTMSLFEQIQQTLITKTSPLLQSDKDAEKMKEVFLKMVDQWKKKNYRYFFIWRQFNQDFKFNNMMMDSSKSQMIRRMIEFLKSSQNSSTRKVLKSFHKYYRIELIKNRVFSKLLDTNAGKIINLFTKWKNVPLPENPKYKVRVAKFERALTVIATRPYKAVFDVFKSTYQYALQKKTQVALAMMNKSQSKHKKLFSRWRTTVKEVKQQLMCKRALGIFQLINQNIVENLNEMIKFNLDLRVKVKALERIGSNFKRYKQKAFDRWRAISQEERAEEEVEEEMVKRSSLKSLEQETAGQYEKCLKGTLQQFKLHMRFNKLQLNLFRFLDKNQREDTRRVIVRWLNLPLRNFPQESNQFEKQLSSFSHSPYREFLERLKQAKENANKLKNTAVTRLVNNQKQIQLEALKRLQTTKNESQKLNQIIKLQKTFEFLQQLIISNLQPIIQSENESVKKNRAVQKMVNHHRSTQIGAIRKWANYLKLMKLADQRKKLGMNILTQLLCSSEKQKQIEALRKVRKHSKISKIKQKFIGKVLESGVGLVFSLFHKWKYIPQIIDAEQKLQFAKFQSKLQNFVERRNRGLLDSLEQFSSKVDLLKKRAIIVLMEKSIHNHKRLFMLWRKSTNEQLQYRKCKQIVEFFSSLNFLIQQQTLNQLKTNAKSALIEKVIVKLSYSRTNQLKDTLQKWKQGVQFAKIFDGQYKDILRRMVDSLKNNGTTHMRIALRQFQINRKIRIVQTAFFKQLFSTNVGQTMTVFRKWKSIPSRSLVAANYFQIKLQRIVFMKKRCMIDALKLLNQEAETVKQGSLQNLLNKTMSSSRRFFIDWKTMVQTERIIKRCQVTINLFETLMQTMISNTSLVLKTDRDRAIVEKVVQRLLSITSNRSSNALKQWKAVVQFEKMAKDSKQRDMIQRMQDNLKSSGRNRFRQALSAFQKYYKIKKIKMKVFDSLFATSAGKMIKVFMSWKSLPVPVNVEEKVKCIRFEQALHRLQQKPYKISFGILQSSFRDGEEKKKMFMQEMLNRTMSTHKKMFLKWSSTTKNEKKIGKCKRTIDFFDSLNDVICQSAQYSLFQSIGEHTTKMTALNRIIAANQDLRKHSWNHWLKNVMFHQYKDVLRKNALKQMIEQMKLLKNKFASYSFNCFNKENKLQKLVYQLYKRLGNVKQQETFSIFSMWRHLPDNTQKDKVHLFADKLVRISQSRLKQLIESMRDVKSQAQEVQKRSITHLGMQLNGLLKRAFDQWNFDKQNIAVKRCQQTIQFFDSIQRCLQIQVSSVFEDRKSLYLKQKYIEKLIEVQYAGAKKAIQAWRKFVFDSVVSDEMKKRIISNLVSVQGKSTAGGLRRVLQQFLKFKTIRKIQFSFFSKLLDTSIGSQMTVFQKWKALPILIPGSEMIRSNKFERGLNQFATKRLRTFFNPLKSGLTLGLMIKKDCLQKLSDLTMSDHKKMFLRWSTSTKQFKQNMICRRTMDLFQNLNKQIRKNIDLSTEFNKESNLKKKAIQQIVHQGVLKEQKAFSSWLNLHITVTQAEKCRKTIELFEIIMITLKSKTSPLLQNTKDETLKTKVIEKLLAASRNNLETAFRTWVQVMRFDRLGDETKKMMIKMLKNAVSNQGTGKMRQIIRQFKKNASIKRYQMQFFQKLLQLNAGQQMVLFQKWKGLPIPVNIEERRNMAVFQSKLAAISTKRLKEFLDKIKDTKNIAELKKKKAIYLLLKKTMGIPQKLFLKWRTTTADQKRFEHWNSISKVFDILNQQIKKNVESTVLERTGAIENQERVRKLVTLLERVRSLFERQKREGFQMISKKSSSMTLRSYFASLWKWKFANLEARYYMKYKQIYRQSAVMSRFVQIVQYRFYENLTSGLKGLKNFGNRNMRLLNCIRIREKEEIKQKAYGFSQWKQKINMFQYQESFNELMTSIAQQKLQKFAQIIIRLQKRIAYHSISSLSSEIFDYKERCILQLATILQQTISASNKRKMQIAFDSLKFRIGLQKTSFKMQALFKLINMDSFRIKQLSFALNALKENAFDSSSIKWESSMVEHLFALSDFKISFDVLKNAALSVSKRTSIQSSSEQLVLIPSIIIPPAIQSQPQTFSRRSFGLPPQPHSIQSSVSSGHLLQTYSNPHKRDSDSIVRDLIQDNVDQGDEKDDDQQGIQNILARIGKENLKLVNRLGAADKINDVLNQALNRNLFNGFSVIKSRLLMIFNEEGINIQDELKAKQEGNKKQALQLQESFSTKKALEYQVQQLSLNQKQQQTAINQLQNELEQNSQLQDELTEELEIQQQQLAQKQDQFLQKQQLEELQGQQQLEYEQPKASKNLTESQKMLLRDAQLQNQQFFNFQLKRLYFILNKFYTQNMSEIFEINRYMINQAQEDQISSNKSQDDQELLKQVTESNQQVESAQERVHNLLSMRENQIPFDQGYQPSQRGHRQQYYQQSNRGGINITITYPQEIGDNDQFEQEEFRRSSQVQQPHLLRVPQQYQYGQDEGQEEENEQLQETLEKIEQFNTAMMEKKLNFFKRLFANIRMSRLRSAFAKMKYPFYESN